MLLKQLFVVNFSLDNPTKLSSCFNDSIKYNFFLYRHVLTSFRVYSPKLKVDIL